MSLPEIKYCPGTLAEGFTGYSSTCLKRVFHGKRVSHVLPYNPPQLSEEDAEKFIENRKRISISGVQEKLSLILEKNKLRLTSLGEQGTHILKPIPTDLKKADQVPANEHLTMQIARQVYKIPTAESALIFFRDGTIAYITKRFDIKEDGTKRAKEDFATLAGKTSSNAGPSFKYNYSYEAMAGLIEQYIPASAIELEKFYTLVVFNYLFSNGDAHLKNFSVLETDVGDHVLSPAYDLINTCIHVNDTDFALSEGLFQDNFESEEMKQNGWVGLEDFHEFGRRLGLDEKARERLLTPFLQMQPLVKQLIDHSYLDESNKSSYWIQYQTKRKRLDNSVMSILK